MNRCSRNIGLGKISGYALVGLLTMASAAFAFDVNGDGREGLPEAIHSLQVSTGMIPSSSTIVYVGPVGTSPENGTALRDALNGITDASSTNPYLLKIEPGIYDLGDAVLVMKPYVDIEGSGQHTTTITSTHSGSGSDSTSATVEGATEAEIRFLTIENRGGGNNSLALYNYFSPLTLTNVTVRASGGIHNYGVYNNTSATPMTNVALIVFGGSTSYGVYNNSSSPPMTNVSITALNGTLANVGVVNGNSSSPRMNQVDIIASGGSGENTGIDNSTYSSPTLFDVSVIVSSTGTASGVKNYNHSSPTITMVTADVSGGFSYGLYNDYYCSPSVAGLSVTNSSYGVYNKSASGPVIRNSAISGSLYSITNLSGTTVKVANSMLTGLVTGSGFTCVGAYTQAFSALDTTCH